MRPVLTLAVLLAASAGAHVFSTPQDPPRFVSASSELVVLPVVVTDRQGRLVADLPRDRFVVFDNGRSQPIALFSNEDTPVTVGLIVDDSRSMAPKLAEVVAAALAFAHSSNPQDELFTIAFNDRVLDTMPAALPASDQTGLSEALTSLRPDGRTALYDAIVAGLDRLTNASHARKVLIVISDGGDNASRATLKEVLARARQSNVTIYTIGIFEADDPDANPGVLKDLVETSGGERFLPRSPGALMQDCLHIAREIRSGYTIGYVPPDHDGVFHRVRVLVQPSDRHLTIRTRPGYFAAGRPTNER